MTIKNPPGPPMTLGVIRQLGVRGLLLSCCNPRCRHEAIFSAEDYADEVELPSFAARIVCSKCGDRVAIRPNWKEMPIPPPSLLD